MAIQLDSSESYAHYNLGNIFMKKKDYQKAVGHYESALIYNPTLFKARYNLGLIHLQKGDRKAARMEFEAALKINPNHHWARKMLESIPD